MQALRINTLSKLTFSDSIRFDALLKDVFQSVQFKDIEYENLAKAIREVCTESSLVVNEIQVGNIKSHNGGDEEGVMWRTVCLVFLCSLTVYY